MAKTPESSQSKRLLVVGATGLVGSAAVRHFRALADWEVVSVSRRQPIGQNGSEHIAMDITDRDAVMAALVDAGPITHILYAALYEKPSLVAGWLDDDQIKTNLTMIQNVLDGVENATDTLQHLTLIQGTKAYGSHVGRVPVPAKERWPRMSHKIFYWPQEDLLKERSESGGWNYSVLRPQLILGLGVGSPMSIVTGLGVYASIMRELGEPLHYPGGGRFVIGATDSRLIAEATEFVGTHPIAAGETYNVVNGDVLLWEDIWAGIAARFSMPVGDHQSRELARWQPEVREVWQRIADSHELVESDVDRLLGTAWQFADRNFGYGFDRPDDRLVSPIKLRQAGFANCYDTEDAIHFWLGQMQDARLLPR